MQQHATSWAGKPATEFIRTLADPARAAQFRADPAALLAGAPGLSPAQHAALASGDLKRVAGALRDSAGQPAEVEGYIYHGPSFEPSCGHDDCVSFHDHSKA